MPVDISSSMHRSCSISTSSQHPDKTSRMHPTDPAILTIFLIPVTPYSPLHSAGARIGSHLNLQILPRPLPPCRKVCWTPRATPSRSIMQAEEEDLQQPRAQLCSSPFFLEIRPYDYSHENRRHHHSIIQGYEVPQGGRLAQDYRRKLMLRAGKEFSLPKTLMKWNIQGKLIRYVTPGQYSISFL